MDQPLNPEEISPLQAAAMAGDLAGVKRLVESGTPIYQAAQWGYPAVQHAHWEKQTEVVKYFLTDAANDKSQLGAPTFGLGIDVNLAARNGWTEIVKMHLQRDPLATQRRGVIGETPLHWAAHNGHVEIVNALLDAGADIEADEINCYGGKALHWASEHAPEIVKILLQRGANVEGRNVKTGAEYEGVTPLIMVATQRNDCVECASLLLAAGADVHATDAKGRTALMWARKSGAVKVAKLLESHG